MLGISESLFDGSSSCKSSNWMQFMLPIPCRKDFTASHLTIGSSKVSRNTCTRKARSIIVLVQMRHSNLTCNFFQMKMVQSETLCCLSKGR